ncbi:MAG: succinylglutamate desuccinylase/aspartoacylase family protein [Polyangiales bacterium]
MTRIIDRHEGAPGGPTVVVTGGVHGNEPAGLTAALEVLAALRARKTPLRGRVLAVTGNRGALGLGQRFVERDLNRRWDQRVIDALRARPLDGLAHEDREQRELADLFFSLERDAVGPIVFIDLHTTSGASPPFVCLADTLGNRDLADALPLPKILGLEEVLDASMLGYLTDRGHVGFAVEGGRHDEPETVTRHAASLWLLLERAGAVARADVPDREAHRATVYESARGVDPVVEIVHRHVVARDDDFVMEPGWRSFQPVAKGAVVARDRRGPIATPHGGLMLMPRYQPQGEDGYFIVRPVRPFWLGVSTVLRRARADRLMGFLPGVTREREDPERLIVGDGWQPPKLREVMHLFGYRRVERSGAGHVFSRRRESRARRP